MTGKIRRSAGAASCVLIALTGCGAGSEGFEPAPVPGVTCPQRAGGPITLVVGARANSPKPDLPVEVRGLVREAAKQSQPVQVIRVDGEPSVALSATFQTNGKNSTKRERDLESFLDQTHRFVYGLKPKVAEANVLGALTEAAHVTPEGGTIVLQDSGLATAGPVSFTDADMFGVEPADVTAYLESQRLMPKLSGRAVLLVGLGNTAEPQAPLTENLLSRVGQIWSTIAAKAGATCVAQVSTALRRTAAETTVPVTQVELPKPITFKPCGTTVLADSDSVGFVVGTARMRDREAGLRVLRQLADQVRRQNQKVRLVGNTSSDGPSKQFNLDLSRRRAEAIRAELVKLGVPGDRISTRGDGYGGEYYINDRGPGGVLLPGPAAHNRSVVVELMCAR